MRWVCACGGSAKINPIPDNFRENKKYKKRKILNLTLSFDALCALSMSSKLATECARRTIAGVVTAKMEW